MSNGKDVYGCPVCEGVAMQKLRPSQELELILDYCDDCGGMWFEAGEVRQLRLCRPEVLGSLITVKKQLHAVECPSCRHPVTRNAGECAACGHANTIDCPGCGSELERVQSDRFTVDVCRACRGVWFDNIDLSQVWNLQFEDWAESAEGDSAPSSEDGSTEDTVVAILRYSRGGDPGAEAGSEADRSRNVFTSIADIIGGIFSASD